MHVIAEANEVASWIEEWGPLIGLASTVMLLFVTAWYAFLTKRMADAGRDAARHAETAAKASMASVAATQASAEVTFSVEPGFESTVGELSDFLEQSIESGGLDAENDVTIAMIKPAMRVSAISIVNNGATVYVHDCQLKQVTHPDQGRSNALSTVYVDTDLSAKGASRPVHLHKGEGMRLSVPQGIIEPNIVHLELVVLYSFDGGDATYRRAASWSASRSASDTEKPIEGISLHTHSWTKPKR